MGYNMTLGHSVVSPKHGKTTNERNFHIPKKSSSLRLKPRVKSGFSHPKRSGRNCSSVCVVHATIGTLGLWVRVIGEPRSPIVCPLAKKSRTLKKIRLRKEKVGKQQKKKNIGENDKENGNKVKET